MLLHLITGLLIAALAHSACASGSTNTSTSTNESLLARWTFNGFGTLGVVHNTDSDSEFLRDLSQPQSGGGQTSLTQDSLLGGQARYRFNPYLDGVVQVVSKYNHEGNYAPDVSWAFLKYHTDSNLELRAGRLGVDLFFRTDSRDIGYSYLWVRPPTDFYGVLNFSRFDGVDATQQFYLNDGIFLIKGFMGLVNQQSYLFDGGSDDFNDSPIYGLIGEYQASEWTFRASFSELKNRGIGAGADFFDFLESNGATALADDLSAYGKRFRYYSLGAAWEHDAWRVQMAFSHTDGDSLTYPDNHAAYLSLGYRLDGWTPYVLLSGIRSDQQTRSSGLGAATDAAVTTIIKGSYTDQRTLAVGARIDVMENVALKMQVEHIRSDVVPSLLMGADTEADWDGDTTLFSLSLDFVF